MESQGPAFLSGGASMNKPPAFSGDDYPYWADRMEMYIKSTQYRLWRIITLGDIPIVKPEDDWGNEEYSAMELNSKARYALTCALSRTEYNRFCAYKTAKELWDALKISYEGTEDVRMRKAATLQREYEMFSMKKDESIDMMFGRFQTILNGLTSLGITFTKAQNNMKILDSLPTPWEAMSTAISVGRDMKTLTLDELIGALRVHEVLLCKRDKIKIQEPIALPSVNETPKKESAKKERKKKSKILKAESTESDSSEESSEDEVSLMARRFKKMMMKKGRGQRFFKKKEKKFPEKSSSKEESTDIVCYECRKPGHMRSECPKLKRRWNPRKDKRKKGLLTWEDLDSESSEDSTEEEETANICLMAGDAVSSEVTEICTTSSSSSESESESEEMSYDTLLANSHFIAQQYKVCKAKLKQILKENATLKYEKELLQKKVSDESSFDSEKNIFILEIEKLKKENESLVNDLTKFTKGSSILKNMLKYERSPSDKSGLGYVKETDEKKTEFASSDQKKKNKNYNKVSNVYKKNTRTLNKKKSSSTNKRGPKKIWVPKSLIIPVADILNRKREDFKLVPGQWLLTTHDGRPVYVPRSQTK